MSTVNAHIGQHVERIPQDSLEAAGKLHKDIESKFIEMGQVFSHIKATKIFKMKCPVCSGKGTITEDSGQYLFVTRDPDTHICLTCMGSGYVGPRKKLPSGEFVFEIARQQKAEEQGGKIDIGIDTTPPKPRRLNVSVKARVVERSRGREGEMDRMDGLDAELRKAPLREDGMDTGSFYGRRVMDSGEAYILVPESSPIYLDTYDFIRNSEMRAGKWTAVDEELYIVAYKNALRQLKEAING